MDRLRKRGSLWMIVLLVAGIATSMPLLAEEGDDMPAGQSLFLAQKCNLCHSVPCAEIEAKTENEKMRGPDLVDLDLDPEWAAQYVTKKVQKDGADHKKEFKGTDEELQTLISWLLEQKSEG